MPVLIKSREDGNMQIVLHNEPDYVIALRGETSLSDLVLQHGSWIIMNAAEYSGPDLMNIAEALAATKRFDGRLRLAIRTFESHEELKRWCPNITEGFQSPIFLFLKKGQVGKQVVGAFDQEILFQMAKEFFEGA